MKLAEARTSFRFQNLTVPLGKSGPGEAPARDALAVCRATGPVFRTSGNRNVPPERDVEPAILSLAELRSRIQVGGRRRSARGWTTPRRARHQVSS